ncbi:hypothetical protein ACOJUR_02230 [Alicyclobacillus tolerans]|uniref:Uncharacterized protein n=1 Tax=Alicyclobacillus tolerans TaxID=90970 RepID=A0A1M6RA49_9BACL|nr:MULTISPECIES: hypothetical protein [Alicyclobacillus]QRF22385.1 hypothetical protein FY534_00835 [Alicyclobacillus sp. TC]SHK29300.1 hypothetical protein SAMN05443507_11199 [Alicyclobacillus montanus]
MFGKQLCVVMATFLFVYGLVFGWSGKHLALANTVSVANRVQMEFRVASGKDFKRIAGARIILVQSNGSVLTSGQTNTSGVWRADVPLQQDPRFAGVEKLGIVTAIAVANGFNEEVVFEVPVKQDMVQPIILNPIRGGRRNEPVAVLGNLHRNALAKLVSRYATQLGLKRQTIPTEFDVPPWSPNQKS